MEQRKMEEEQRQKEREEQEKKMENERDQEREEWEKERERRVKEEEKLRKRLKKAKKKGPRLTQEEILTSNLAAEYDEEKIIFLQRAIRRWLIRKRWSVMGSYSKSKESLKVRLRNEALKEVLDSERVYVHRLQFAIKHFLTPLEDSTFTKKALLTSDQISSIFLQIDVIEAVNRTLLNALEERMEQWPAVTEIGDIFRRLAPIMKLYSSYIRNFKKGQDVLVEVKKTNSEFAEWLTKKEMDPSCGHDLPSFLILPVQRLPRYQMLIEGVLKHIEKEHADYNNLVAARESVVSVIFTIEEEGRTKENRERVISIQESLELEGLFGSEGEARRIKGEGGVEGFVVEEVTMVSGENGTQQHVFYPSCAFEFHPVGPNDVLYPHLTTHHFVIRELQQPPPRQQERQEEDQQLGFVQGGCVLHWIDVISKGAERGVLKVQRAISLEHGASILTTSLPINPTTTWGSFLEQYCKKILHRNAPLPSSLSQMEAGWVALPPLLQFPSCSSLSGILQNCSSWEINYMLIFEDHLLFCWKKGNGSLRNPTLIIPTLFRSISVSPKKEIHVSVLTVGGIFCRFSFSFLMATPVEEKKMMSGLAANFTEFGCAVGFGGPLTWEGSEAAGEKMGERLVKGGGEIFRIVKNTTFPKKEDKEFSIPLSPKNATSRKKRNHNTESESDIPHDSPVKGTGKKGKGKSFILPAGANSYENECSTPPSALHSVPFSSPPSSQMSPLSSPSSPFSSSSPYSPPSSPSSLPSPSPFSLSSSPPLKKEKGSRLKRKEKEGKKSERRKKKEGSDKKKERSPEKVEENEGQKEKEEEKKEKKGSVIDGKERKRRPKEEGKEKEKEKRERKPKDRKKSE